MTPRSFGIVVKKTRRFLAMALGWVQADEKHTFCSELPTVGKKGLIMSSDQ